MPCMWSLYVMYVPLHAMYVDLHAVYETFHAMYVALHGMYATIYNLYEYSGLVSNIYTPYTLGICQQTAEPHPGDLKAK